MHQELPVWLVKFIGSSNSLGEQKHTSELKVKNINVAKVNFGF